jgi:cell division septum initiation protein DivIVA
MIDPVSALSAVQSAVALIKKASKTVDDVASLGPMIGKYFEAKHTATKAVHDAKKQGGSSMGKAIEIELALKSQRDFEQELQNLFFSTNNMDVWQAIKKRASDMDAANASQMQKDAIADAKRKRKEEQLNEILLVVGIAVVISIFLIWAAWEAITFCSNAVCGR